MNRVFILPSLIVISMCSLGCLPNQDQLNGELVDVSACSIYLADTSHSDTRCLEPSFERWRQRPTGSFVGCLLEKHSSGFRALPIRLDEVDGIRTFVAPDYRPSDHGTVSILFLDTFDPMSCQELEASSGCHGVANCYLALGPMVIGQHDSFQNGQGECMYTDALQTLVPATHLCD
jgi:hypothetical protein